MVLGFVRVFRAFGVFRVFRASGAFMVVWASGLNSNPKLPRPSAGSGSSVVDEL